MEYPLAIRIIFSSGFILVLTALNNSFNYYYSYALYSGLILLLGILIIFSYFKINKK